MKQLLACAVLAACSSAPAPQLAAPQRPSQMTGGLEHGMLNCPSAVESARTTVRNTERGVDVTVTTTDPAARVELIKLAHFHASQDRMSDWPEHTGKHGGPGSIGHCPILHEGTVITLSDTENGVILHVVARSSDRVRWLQEQTAERAASIPSWLPRSAQR